MDNLYTTHKIIRRIIGEITPIGESREDEKRLYNLSETNILICNLLDEIIDVARYKDSQEASVKRIGRLADDCITEIRERLNE